MTRPELKPGMIQAVLGELKSWRRVVAIAVFAAAVVALVYLGL